MKKSLSLSFITGLIFCVTAQLQAQQSCSFVTHVDGTNGIDTSSCGKENSPCKTISYGIDRALSTGDTLVRITSGNYSEIVELADGISLWGGFSASWEKQGTTTITGGLAGNGEYYTLSADSLEKHTVLSDLTILAPNVPAAGKSSYGLHITYCKGLQLQRIKITGGKGGDGTEGSTGTSATLAGVNGFVGGNSAEYSISCDDFTTGLGGLGAVTPGFPLTAGGTGGRGGYMDQDCSFPPFYDATPGLGGNNASVYTPGSYGYAGTAGAVCLAGGAGKNGKTVHGEGGNGALTPATLAGLFWIATSGENGTTGENGTGGGGGGGSGGCDDGTDSHGAGGGGGGSGGIAAPAAGSGGMSGGHSVALFIHSSTCSLADFEIIMGTGGNGGKGGNSGLGSKGGTGADGGKGIGTGAGGKGGDGGDGGNSGAGGGGAGGFAYGIYGVNAILNRMNTIFSGGNPGTGGIGGTGTPDSISGSDGIDGNVVQMGGTIQDNVITVKIKEDPCTEFLSVHQPKPMPLVIYPNPTHNGTINIEGVSLQPVTISILDMSGRLVTQSVMKADQKLMLQIPVKGIFFVKSTMDGKTLDVQVVCAD